MTTRTPRTNDNGWTVPTAMRHLETRIAAVEKSIVIALDAQREQTALMFRVLTIALLVVGLLAPAIAALVTYRMTT